MTNDECLIFPLLFIGLVALMVLAMLRSVPNKSKE